MTTYVAEQLSSVVTVKVLKSEGFRERPKRRLHVQLLLGKCAMVCFMSHEVLNRVNVAPLFYYVWILLVDASRNAD